MCFRVRICFLVVILTASILPAYSQTLSDTLRLDDIIITATRVPEPRKHQPIQVQIIDSVTLKLSGSSSLAQILESHSGLFIRNYGPSGASTISQRGMVAHQTQVYWNGFNINHPMLGLMDVNTLSAGMISSIEINSVGSSAYGGGSLGGSIQIATNDNQTGLDVSQSVGSFGRIISSGGAGVKGDHWQFNAQAIRDYSENDFPYRDYTRNPTEERKRNNNKVETRSMLANGGYSFGKSEVRSGLWYSHSQRGVPGPIQSQTMRANQEDEFLRWHGNYQIEFSEVKLGGKAYLNRQELNYINPQDGINSLSTNTSGLFEIPVSYDYSKSIKLNGIMAASRAWVESTAYNDEAPDRTHYSAQLNPLIVLIDRFKLYPSVRVDHYNDFGHAFSYALGLNYAVVPQSLIWRAYASSDFNAPTFNDLYWPDSGNPDLQPEEGWKMETGFNSTLLQGNFVQETDGQVFISRLKNGIQWIPGERVFRPQNVREINARGFELQSNTAFLTDSYTVKIAQILSGTWSTYGKSRFPGDQAQGKQLIHTPVWQYKMSAILDFGPLNMMITPRWIGTRYVDEDNQNAIEAYSVVDYSLAYSLKVVGITTDLQWNLMNSLNADYEVIPYYPIPGRNHLITLRISI
ncbi:MAG: TonB-dependent receptor [Balneolales bacterium]